MIDLDNPIHICTPRTILNELLKEKRNMETFRNLAHGENLTVNHDLGSFVLTYEDVTHLLGLWRLRGKL